MPYYDTIEEDLKRAKEILAKGRLTRADLPLDIPDDMRNRFIEQSGSIYASDSYAAYKILESFVIEIERLRKVIRRQASV